MKRALALLTLSWLLAAADDPFAGTWKANLAKSKPDPNHRFQNATMRFQIDGELVKLVISGVNAAGKQVSSTQDLRADGKERDAPGAPGIFLVVNRPDPRTLEMLGRKGGQLISRAVYSVSADGKTLTAKVGGVDDKSRALDHYIVFDRE